MEMLSSRGEGRLAFTAASSAAREKKLAASRNQTRAVRHGIARALLEFDVNLRPALKRAGLLTRDPRMRERKKYGQPGARSKFQYSKR